MLDRINDAILMVEHDLRQASHLRSGVYSLPAELAYVQDFLGEGLAYGQQGYALVSLQCACHYAQQLAWGQGLLQPKPEREPPDGHADVVTDATPASTPLHQP